jgi:multidrug resistance efflux pump
VSENSGTVLQTPQPAVVPPAVARKAGPPWWRQVLVNLVVFVVVLAAGVGGYLYSRESARYVSTDDAQVAGDQIAVVAPTAGQLVSWRGTMGSTFTAGATVGEIQVSTAAVGPGVNIPIGQPAQDIPVIMPRTGTIAENNAVPGEFVTPGTPLAYAYDLKRLYVLANVKETDVNSIVPGDPVEVYVDALPGVVVHGVVTKIDPATAATFALIPQTSTNANFTKVTQVVPVKIALKDPPTGLVPGESATVNIEKAVP